MLFLQLIYPMRFQTIIHPLREMHNIINPFVKYQHVQKEKQPALVLILVLTVWTQFIVNHIYTCCDVSAFGSNATIYRTLQSSFVLQLQKGKKKNLIDFNCESYHSITLERRQNITNHTFFSFSLRRPRQKKRERERERATSTETSFDWDREPKIAKITSTNFFA